MCVGDGLRQTPTTLLYFNTGSLKQNKIKELITCFNISLKSQFLNRDPWNIKNSDSLLKTWAKLVFLSLFFVILLLTLVTVLTFTHTWLHWFTASTITSHQALLGCDLHWDRSKRSFTQFTFYPESRRTARHVWAWGENPHMLVFVTTKYIPYWQCKLSVVWQKLPEILYKS